MAELTLEAIQALLAQELNNFKTEVNSQVNKAITARFDRYDDQIEKRLAPQPPKEEQTQEALSLKALNAKFEASEKARIAAEHKSSQLKVASDFQAHFQKHLGADSPHLKPYLKYYEDRLKVGDDGNTYIKMAREGYEDFIPLEQGMKELVDTDLKHLVAAKTSHLPPSGPQSVFRGSTFQPKSQDGPNPIMAEMLASIANPIKAQ
jgi:hypothetical protein